MHLFVWFELISISGFIQSGDSLHFHNGQKFTTTDKDQDIHNLNCARIAYGGFWYSGCSGANPTGIYAWGPSPHVSGIHWTTFKGLDYSLKTMIMKIRPTAA